jgi:two-component system chemotaxis response regulator CheY
MKPRKEMRVLVVDDQKSMRGLATYYLKQIEFEEIDEAESARDALMQMQKKRYDLLLLDWNMEGMSGIDLLKAIRSIPELNKIKIIMATSERSVDKVDEAKSNGADHYVVKPYELRDLEMRIAKVFES